MVLAVEAAGRSIKLMKNGDMKTEPELHKLTGRHEAEAGKKVECRRCGNKTQLEQLRKFKNAKCFECSKKEHISVMCRAKGKKQNTK